MARKRLFVIAYDIVSDSRRTRIAALLEHRGIRVQFSVFECRLTHTEAKSLMTTLEEHMDHGDNIRCYHVPDAALAFSHARGGAPLAEPGNYFLF